MREHRIDAVAKGFARNLPRRGLLGGLGGGLLAIVGLLALPRSALVCQRVGKPCTTDNACCHGATCQGGRCACRSGWDTCNGRDVCVNSNADDDHCGRCGNACAAAKTCCAGGCVDVKRDRANCGGCGTACGEYELCVLGSCLACPLGTAPCRSVCRPPGKCDKG